MEYNIFMFSVALQGSSLIQNIRTLPRGAMKCFKRSSHYEITRKIVSLKVHVNPLIMMEFILIKVARVSWSRTTYLPTRFAFGENGDLVAWQKGITGNNYYLLQTPRSGHKEKTSAKLIRDKFKDYFITKSALKWHWKYCWLHLF